MTQIERDILTTGAGKPDQDWQISPGKRGILAIPLLSAPRQDTNSLGGLGARDWATTPAVSCTARTLRLRSRRWSATGLAVVRREFDTPPAGLDRVVQPHHR